MHSSMVPMKTSLPCSHAYLIKYMKDQSASAKPLARSSEKKVSQHVNMAHLERQETCKCSHCRRSMPGQFINILAGHRVPTMRTFAPFLSFLMCQVNLVTSNLISRSR